MSETEQFSAEIAITPLQASLEAQQHAEALKAAQEAAIVSVGEASVNALTFLKPSFDSDNARGMLMTVGHEKSPSVRNAVKVIESAAAQTGVPSELQTENRRNEATRKKFQDGEPIVAWAQWSSGIEVSFSDPNGTLRAKAAEIQDSMNVPFTELQAKLSKGETTAFTSDTFSLTNRDTQDLVFSFMRKEPRGQTAVSRGVRFIDSFTSTENTFPVRLAEEGWPEFSESGRGIYLNADGAITKIVTEIPDHPGVYHGMYFETGTGDLTNAKFRLGVEIDEARASCEYGFEDSVAKPFIQSKTATEIINTTTQHGLQPTERLKGLLVGDSEAIDRRFGNSYSELGREIAKYVNNPSRDATKLFEGDEATVRQTLATMDAQSSSSEPAMALLTLLAQSMGRSPEAESDSSIPVHEGRVHMKDMSCKDVEGAYAEGTAIWTLTLEKVGNTVMAIREKGHQRSAINLYPVRYKGVDLPPGSLFQVHDDGSFMFVRPTAMQFDKADGKDAFGWQYHEGMNKQGSSNELVHELQSRYQAHEERLAWRNQISQGYLPPEQPPAQS